MIKEQPARLSSLGPLRAPAPGACVTPASWGAARTRVKEFMGMWPLKPDADLVEFKKS